MASTPEAKVRNPVIGWAVANGVLHIRMTFRPGTRSGWPDDMFGYRGRVVWVEFKAPGKTPRPLQLERIEQLNAQGIAAAWFDNALAATLFLKQEFGL